MGHFYQISNWVISDYVSVRAPGKCVTTVLYAGEGYASKEAGMCIEDVQLSLPKLIKNALKFDILEKIMCVLEVSKMATILHFYKTKSHFYVYCWLQKQKTHKVFQHRQCRVCKGGTASQRTEDNCVLICKCINFSIYFTEHFVCWRNLSQNYY